MAQISFKHPTTVVLAEPTQCGKTHFLIRGIRGQCFQPDPQRIVWVYGETQAAYEDLARDVRYIEFVKGFTNELYETFDPQVRNLLILDDQMENKLATKRGDNGAVKFFTQGSHHRNLTVVYIVQNLFNQDPAMRTISLNTHYMVLFKNPRDATQIRTLGQQMYPANPQLLVEAYRDATSRPYGYLLLDLRPDTCDAFRILTDVFAAQPTAYAPLDTVRKAQWV
jgi:hypothetical protein